MNNINIAFRVTQSKDAPKSTHTFFNSCTNLGVLLTICSETPLVIHLVFDTFWIFGKELINEMPRNFRACL